MACARLTAWPISVSHRSIVISAKRAISRSSPAPCRKRRKMAQAEKPVIVLVRPQLGENIGKAARAMLNFGLTEMRLVAPRDGWPNPDAGPAASGADIVLAQAQVFDALADADRKRVV